MANSMILGYAIRPRGGCVLGFLDVSGGVFVNFTVLVMVVCVVVTECGWWCAVVIFFVLVVVVCVYVWMWLVPPG